jgi:uracil-DNA glycosylase
VPTGDPSRARSLRALAAEAADCRACPLFAPATQTVFGEGSSRATMMIVGEQPGDQEDRRGQPFVGPAGRVLDRAFAEVGIDRTQVYVTNAVKHFKFHQRGKRRIHQKPNGSEIEACHPWLAAELRLVRPEVLVLMGTVAVRSVLGSGHTITALRGRTVDYEGVDTVVTIHPSAVLRAEDREQRFGELVEDLRRAASLRADV